jgi:hypothetical protein
MQQCVALPLSAAGNGLSTGLSTTTKYLRRTASGAAGKGLGTTIKYLLRTRNGAAGTGLGTTAKYLWQATAVGNRLASTIQYLCDAAIICLSTTNKYRAQWLKLIFLHIFF